MKRVQKSLLSLQAMVVSRAVARMALSGVLFFIAVAVYRLWHAK